MLKGLAITPPIIGRISIGKVVEQNGKRLPKKDDEFTLTSQVQQKGEWLLHPKDAELRSQLAAHEKLRAIPVNVLFNDPDLNLRAQYSLFDRSTGRAVCVGNGETCKRLQHGKWETFECPSPDACQLGTNNQCKPYGRLNVVVGNDDELGSFIFRTTGFNSIRTLAARLSYFAAVSGSLATMPLELRIRSKSTTQSHRAPIYYVDLVVRNGISLNEAIAQAKQLANEREQAGFNQTELDNAARLGFAAGEWEESSEDGLTIVEEFYAENETTRQPENGKQTTFLAGSLKEKLAGKVERLTETIADTETAVD